MASERRSPRPFTVTIRHAAPSMGDGATPILDLHGEVDGFAAPLLQTSFSSAAGPRPPHIALNFGDVDYINSTGIALIVGLLAEARRSNVVVVSYGLSEHYTEIFRITRLADYMRIVADEAAALDSSHAAEPIEDGNERP